MQNNCMRGGYKCNCMRGGYTCICFKRASKVSNRNCYIILFRGKNKNGNIFSVKNKILSWTCRWQCSLIRYSLSNIKRGTRYGHIFPTFLLRTRQPPKPQQDVKRISKKVLKKLDIPLLVIYQRTDRKKMEEGG